MMHVRAVTAAGVHQLARVVAVRAADDDDDVALARQVEGGGLPLFRRLADRIEEALRLFTRGNSWFLRMEEKVGSIEPGKLADLAVLDRDYFSVPDVQIKQIRSSLTVVGGNIVHRQNI